MYRVISRYILRLIMQYCTHVCYLMYTSAVGQTVGAFHRRDGRGDDAEILVARLIDRPIRPMIKEVKTDRGIAYIDLRRRM